MKSRRFPVFSAAVLVVAFLLVPGTSFAEIVTLRIMGWNVESGDADPDVIARRIADEQGVHLWGLCEVAGDRDAEEYEQAAEQGEGTDFKRIVGTTGGSDRLVILYDTNKLDLLGTEQLQNINIGGHVRAPLVARFQGKRTGQQFLFMVNHLYRSRPNRRHQQANLLNQWARSQNVPVIAVGDYNFDWDVQSGDANHDKGYDNITKDETFIWIRPDVLFKTQASNHDSVLDFIFVSGSAAGWKAESTIVKVDGDFPDDSRKSDHRPVDCVFTLDTSVIDGTPTLTKEQIIQRIRELEQEIERLKEAVERLED